ncbi:MAG: hypothetical protein IH623_19835 [Verrucomicrobia bacterium]|nr:hypothetical protein [Verrucomicrobiota bacterium]
MAANIRYMNSGDYLEPAGWQGGVIPGTNDTARFNWGNNTVTLSGEAPLLRNFQMGVDESGQLVVNAGGILNTTGIGGNSTVGNNANAGVIGRLTVNAGGEVNVTNVLFVGASATGILTNDGGTVSISSHLWVGTTVNGVGTISIANGGILSVGGNIGLGTINASTPSNGKGSLYVQDGGILNLSNISPVNSIQPNSVLDISGSGLVIIPGDFTAVMSDYTNALRITAYGGLGTVGIDYDSMNVDKTTLFAIVGEVPPLEVVWNPAANPSGTGKWNESTNWTGFVRPANVTKVTFNVVGAIPCTVTNAALADYVVMGDNGPGGTLIITNGGSLACGADNATAIGYNSNALMVVESGGSASFGTHLWIGLDPDSDGTLIMNGGTVSVAGMFGLGWQGGKGTAQIKGGTLNLAQWDYFSSIQGASVLDVSGTGLVVINGDHQQSANDFVASGKIKANGGAGTVVVDYNNINVGKTTIYPSGLYVPPAQVVWNPALIFPDIDGLWNVSGNWSGGVGPSNGTIVIFNVPEAIPCTVTNAAFAKYVSMGQGGPGGTLIITNGGSLTCSADNWTAIGRNNTALMIVESGGSVTLGEHLWIGLDTGSDGTLIMNGGTVSVAGMFSCGWLSGKGTALINGGTLNLNQWHPTDSIKGDSLLNVAGTGKVVINGDQQASVNNYISAGKITANGGPNVFYAYYPDANTTIISAVMLPPPQQSITGISVGGGNVTITYQTTDQHTYYIESSPSLSPPSWTPVAGSTNTATGDPVTFTYPAGPGPMFFRTVSP